MRRLSLFLGLFVFAVGCDSSTGCDEVLTDLSAPMAESAYFDEAAVARVSPAGINFIESNLSPIVQSFASANCSEVWCPDGWGTCNGANECRGVDPNAAFIGFGIPATTFDTEILFGTYTQRICMPNENPTFEDCNAYVRLDNLDINANSTSADLEVTADITAWSSLIHLYVDNPGPNVGTCEIFLRQAAAPSNPVYKTITADVQLDNGNPLGRLAVRPENVALSITEDDVHIQGCALQYDIIKDFVFGYIEDTIKDSIAELVDSTLTGMLSESCLDAPCSRTDLSYCAADDVCRFNSDDSPVPRLLGLEGNVALDALLGGFSGRADQVAFSTFANNGSTPSGGLTLELQAAAEGGQSDCVPYFPPPTDTMPSFSPSGTGYHAAIGASDRLLNTLMHEAFSSGALCQTLSGRDIGALNSGAVSLIVPSLGELTGGTVPLTIDVLPRTPPRLEIGANITGVDEDGATELIEPLLTLVLEDLDLDIYAERQGALFRALTLRVDLALDLSLAAGANGDIQLVAGDASRWLQETKVLNAEVISESPQDIEDAIPVLIGAVLPLLTGSLEQSFPIPSFSGFALDIDSITGSQTYGTTAYDHTRYAYLALYADLAFDPNNASQVARVDTVAELRDVVLPDLQGIRDGEMVKVFITGDYERRTGTEDDVVLWSRVDGGFWRPLTAGTDLVIKDPVLHAEGFHVVEVAAAKKGAPASQDLTPVEIEVVTDFVPPTVALVEEAGAVQVQVADTMARAHELEVTYKIDGLDRGALTLDEQGHARISVDPVQHQVEVTAVDLVGRLTTARIGQPPIAQSLDPVASTTRPEVAPRSEAPESTVASSGCSQTSDGSLLSLLALLGMLVLRRRR